MVKTDASYNDKCVASGVDDRSFFLSFFFKGSVGDSDWLRGYFLCI